MRMIKEVKKGKPDAQVQILLFSATFDDTIRTFAHNIVGGTANQVSMHLCSPSSLAICVPAADSEQCNQTDSFQPQHQTACSKNCPGL